MKPEYEKYDLIERYLKGELSGAEYAGVESALEGDVAFRAEMKDHQAIHELILDQGLLELKAKMKAYDAGSAGGSSVWKIISTIALVSSLTAIGFITFNNNPQVQDHSAVTDTQPEKSAQTEKTPPVTNTPSEIPERSRTHENHPVTESQTENRAVATDTVSVNEDSHLPHNKVTSPNTIVVEKTAPVVSNPVREEAVIIPEPKAVHCDLEKSQLTFSVTSSCLSSPTGVLSINRTSAFEGKLPVQFSVDGADYSSEYTFRNLYPGVYHLSVKDAQGCVWQDAAEIVIGEKDCEEKEYSFMPAMGEVWKFPADFVSGKIEIYNRQGALVYSRAISGSNPDQWDGTSEGHVLPMGSYSFVFRGEGKAITGYVTLLR